MSFNKNDGPIGYRLLKPKRYTTLGRKKSKEEVLYFEGHVITVP
jgi:hypothetical protein